MPSLTFKMEYVRRVYERYHKASREAKSKLLDEICKVCRWHRKHALRVLARPTAPGKRARRPSRRPPIYGHQTVSILADMWKATGYLCGLRLKAALPDWLPWARTRYQLSPTVEEQLRAISPRQIDRRLAPLKRQLKRRVYGTTKPGTLLKRMIPVKTDHWDVKKAGFEEIDFVSHSGPCAAGTFINTLNSTDIDTLWGERQAIMGKSEVATVDGMKKIEDRLPFALLGIDSDNGSEFINAHLWAFCRKRKGRKVQFTRSRPYKKDDNAHIEQKNWTHVRKLIGYDRYDTPLALHAMNDLYADLRLFQNFFQPSMKLKAKIRKGARLIRRYDAPRTPWQRVLSSPQADPQKVKALAALRKTLDPFALSLRIDQKLARLYALSSHKKIPLPPHVSLRWRSFVYGNSARKRRLLQNTFRPFKNAA
jgi:hypothetical protein